MDQNENKTGITPEDIMKEITSEETPAEVAEEVVAETVEETAEVVETAEEVAAEAAEEVAVEAEEIAEETVEAVVEEPVEEQKTAFVYEVPSETKQNANVYGQYNEAPDYVYEPYQQNVGGEGICIAALVLGIVGFFLNPCYIVSLLAIIFGFFGQAKNNSKKAFAIWGWALGFAAIVLQILGDLLVSLFSGGVGLFVFCC